ncbi:MAG: putative toxin-antitoxin system toxin component, PIN family [PVC group bacterium]
MRIVLDTNVLVSGLLAPFGTCGDIVRMLTSGEIVLCVDARILLEYSDVMHRPQFDINPRNADVVMVYIENFAQVHATVPLDRALPDTDDNPFLEVALSADAECLVTGNLKHFPGHCRAGVRVLSPKEFLNFFRKHRTKS